MATIRGQAGGCDGVQCYHVTWGFWAGVADQKPKTVIIQAAAVVPATAKVQDTGLAVQPGMRVAAKLEAAAPMTEEKPASETKQLEALTAQVHEMREMMMLSLLQNPSASERLRAVSYTSEIRHVNPNIAAALLATLNNDPNVSVRLTTLEALTHFARDPVVREGLIQSILQQDSPLVQAALADAMLKLQEKRAIQPFKKIIAAKRPQFDGEGQDRANHHPVNVKTI